MFEVTKNRSGSCDSCAAQLAEYIIRHAETRVRLCQVCMLNRLKHDTDLRDILLLQSATLER
jgi:hypothetical protein